MTQSPTERSSSQTFHSGQGQPGQERSRHSQAPNVPESRQETSYSRSSQNEPQRESTTTIAPSVVQKIAGVAAREVSGVHAMGGGVQRAMGALRDRMPGTSGSSPVAGVQVEVGEKETAIDLDLVVEYGSSITDLAHAVRRNVIQSVESTTGLDVVEVNIAVNDIHLPEEDDGGEQ